MSDALTIERLAVPDLGFAQLAQGIGLEAWSDQLKATRTREAVMHTFNPDSTSNNAQRLLARMQENNGLFVGVVAKVGDEDVGYAWAANDVSGSPAARFLKRRLGHLPYAWLAQINVLPGHQGQGVGSGLVRAVLDPFRNDQIPTAYVFEENPRALDWFKKRGMNEDGEPEPKINYFPFGAMPVEQIRMVGRTTLGLRNDVAQRQGQDAPRFVIKQRPSET